MILAQSTSNSTALRAAKQLLELWPHSKPANPEIYMAGIGAVLAGYPLAVVQECVDPRLGLARNREFPPTIAAVVEWCDTCKSGYESSAKIKDWQIEQQRRPPQPEYPEEHRAEMLKKIAAIPGTYFK